METATVARATFRIKFTSREKEILEFIARGMKTRQIAHELNISENTVYNHRKNIIRKRDVRSCRELLAAMQ